MWDNIQINIQNIEYETSSGTLFKCPNKSIYTGLMFWHPRKLVRQGSHSYAVRISFTKDWVFKLFSKNKKGNIISEIEITADDFKKCFNTMSSNISQYDNNESFLNIKEPSKVSIKSVGVEKCLLNR